MFTVAAIEEAHDKVKSGADFPKYIQEIKAMGILSFETWVNDSHTEYFGAQGYQTSSVPQYENLSISRITDKDRFISQLKIHQQGETDYYAFCKDCAETGIEKWVVDLEKMTCTYFDHAGHEILVERIPS
jgi:uncharacterized protein YbcV (DUF1398 family)